MNQEPTIEPVISEAFSTVDAVMHDSVAKMGDAAKGILNTVFDFSVQAMHECHRLAEQNVGFCSEMQDAWLKHARQLQESHLKLWATMPIAEWLGGNRGKESSMH